MYKLEISADVAVHDKSKPKDTSHELYKKVVLTGCVIKIFLKN